MWDNRTSLLEQTHFFSFFLQNNYLQLIYIFNPPQKKKKKKLDLILFKVIFINSRRACNIFEGKKRSKTHLCECYSKPPCNAEYLRDPQCLHYNIKSKINENFEKVVILFCYEKQSDCLKIHI